MVEKKTAKLLEAAAGIGALVGGSREQHVEALSAFGYHIGVAFQAQDDLLDVVGEEAAMGKPTFVDARNGRHTFLSSYDEHNDTTHSIVEECTRKARAALTLLPASNGRAALSLLADSLAMRTG
jgi:geranylgeranyl diphosphate synthase type II